MTTVHNKEKGTMVAGRVPSDSLAHYLISGSPVRLDNNGPALQRVLAIVDLNMLLAEVTCAARSPNRSALMEAMDAGVLLLAAPVEAAVGLPPRLERVAKAPEEVPILLNTWHTRVAPRIWFFTVENDANLPPWAAGLPLRDVEDVPYAALFQQLRADLVITNDKDFCCSNGAPVSRMAALRDIRGLARDAAAAVGLRDIGHRGLSVAFRIVAATTRLLAGSPIATGAAALAGAYFLFADSANEGRKMAIQVGAGVTGFTLKLVDEQRSAAERAQAWLHQVQEKARQGGPLTATDVMFRALLASGGTMRPKQLAQSAWAHGHAPSPQAIARLLAADARFVRHDGGHWGPRLGRRPGPAEAPAPSDERE